MLRVGLIQALGTMIFVAETEERILYAFADEASAIAQCEALDVESGVWLFWDDTGAPLEPEFITPNKRGILSVVNGTYRLVPASEGHHAILDEALDEILHIQVAGEWSAESVRSYLAERSASDRLGA